MTDIQLKAIKVWGKESQIKKTIEELAELIAALSKYQLYEVEKRHDKRILIKDISNEIADTEIMIEQIKHILKIENNVEICKKYKLKRLTEFLNKSSH